MADETGGAEMTLWDVYLRSADDPGIWAFWTREKAKTAWELAQRVAERTSGENAHKPFDWDEIRVYPTVRGISAQYETVKVERLGKIELVP